MKKFLLTVILLSFLTANVFAHGSNDLILHGFLIDNKSAQEHKNNLVEFVKTNQKSALLEPDHVNSGYSILAQEDNHLYVFDSESNKTVETFLKGSGNRTDVVIIAEKNGAALMIEHIANRRIIQ